MPTPGKLGGYLDVMQAGGGTIVRTAVDLAVKEINDHGRQTTVLILTDGEDSSIPGIISDKDDLLKKAGKGGMVMHTTTPRLFHKGEIADAINNYEQGLQKLSRSLSRPVWTQPEALMLDPGLRKTVADIRQKFLQCVQTLEQTLSFRNLLASSERLRAKWRDVLHVAHSPHLQHPPPPTFTCAFVGSTGSGKTSILAEMFPGPAKAGLAGHRKSTIPPRKRCIIRLGAPGSAKQNEVIVRSWEKDQIHRLISLAAPENERTNVKVSYQPDHFIINSARGQVEGRGHAPPSNFRAV